MYQPEECCVVLLLWQRGGSVSGGFAPRHSVKHPLGSRRGAVFNLANVLLVAAIDIAAMAVAFPIGIGLALVIAAEGGYLLAPAGNPFLVFGGVALVGTTIFCDALAYRARGGNTAKVKARFIILSLVGGTLMGLFYPLVTKSMSGTVYIPSPCAITFLFICGAAVSNIPVIFILMKSPLDAKASLKMSEYPRARPAWHLFGILGGLIWATGGVASFVSSRAHSVGSAVGQGATMIAVLWAVFIWKEFAGASRKAMSYLAAMFAFFLVGLGALALSPVF
jgi:glucose uptake protein